MTKGQGACQTQDVDSPDVVHTLEYKASWRKNTTIVLGKLVKKSLEIPKGNCIDYFMHWESSKEMNFTGTFIPSSIRLHKGNLLALSYKEEELTSYMLVIKNKSTAKRK
jgi:hypothetical protein